MSLPSIDYHCLSWRQARGCGEGTQAGGRHSPTSMTRCLAVGCRECQCFQNRSCSTGTFSLSKTTITTLCKHKGRHQSCPGGGQAAPSSHCPLLGFPHLMSKSHSGVPSRPRRQVCLAYSMPSHIAPGPTLPYNAPSSTSSHSAPGPTHLDFVGGQGQAFASCWGTQGDRVELALVEVGHGRLS